MTHPHGAASPDQEQALETLRTGQRFLLVGHMRPDGDCIGGQGGLSRGLTALGKQVHIMNPDPVGPEFGYLTEHMEFGAFRGELPEHDVCVLLDFNELSRTGAMAEPIAAHASTKLVIDHHPPRGDAWWDVAYLDPTASATGLLVWRLLTSLGAQVDRVAAAALYTSLATDTGWFRYSNTDAETMAAGAEFLSRGVDPATVFASLNQRKSPSEPSAMGRMLLRTEYHAAGRLAYIDQPLDMDGPPVEDGDAVLDVLRSVGAVEVVLYLRELEPGLHKLSARSKTDFDVNALATRFGGGGHRRASGATLRGSLAELRAQLIAAAEEALG